MRSKEGLARGAILMYHRIGHGRNPWYLQVDPEGFDRQLKLLTERFQPMTLQAMVAAARDGAVPPRSVAVTFDDGYADNLTEALPLLERRGVPATVFVATGFVENQRPYPWDQLEELLLGAPALPGDIDVVFDGLRHRWSVGEGSALKIPDDDPWRSGDPRPGDRHRLLLALGPVFDGMSPEARRAAIEELERWAGHSSMPPPARRPLTTAELKTLSESDLIEIGAHTVWHPMLPALSSGAQRTEVAAGKERLEDLLGEEVVSFAYPHGAHDAETMKLVDEIGLRSGCTTERAATTGEANPFALPRIPADDIPIDVFEERLEQICGTSATLG